MVDTVLSCSIATRSSTNLRSSAGNRTITGPIHCSGVFRLRPRKELGPRIILTKRVVFHGIKLTPLARNNLARNKNGWQFDSRRANSSVSEPDAQHVYEVLIKMLDRWNAHDIEGNLEVYWKSPELLVVIDSEEFSSWQQLHDSYLNGYPDRNSMGFIQPKRIQVKLLKPDLALALTWWSVSFPNSKQMMVGNTTMDLQKFADGWKIVSSHTSTAEM